MKKRTYKATNVNKVDEELLFEQVFDKEIVIGIDVAKTDYFCNIMTDKRESISTIKWKHPLESEDLLELVSILPAKSLVIAMEPSGTYGDPIRNMFINAGIEVYRVSPKRSHDAKEVYDGVPSLHDAKSANIIARLHLDGASELWSFKEKHERDLAAVVNTLDMLKKQFNQNTNRLGSLLARHWPELQDIIRIDRVSILELIKTYGSPLNITKNKEFAYSMLRNRKGNLKEEKIIAILESSHKTLGVPMTPCEEEELVYLVKRTRIIQQELYEAKKKVEDLSEDIESVKSLSKVIGKATAAVVVSSAGDPLKYKAPKQYLKSIGLNLKEKSSGKYNGRLSITKRGSNKARQWIYFAVLRLIQKDEVVKAWYHKKIVRDGGVKMKALIAIMRKLVLSMWHVARGCEFDSEKLFDIRKLQVN
ncbi:MAG: transposase [bacterium]|nr:transposase [bacterium]